MCWYAGCHILDVYRILNSTMCSRHAAEVFSVAKILPNPKLKKKNKRKIFMPNFRYKLWDLGLLRVSVALSLPIP